METLIKLDKQLSTTELAESVRPILLDHERKTGQEMLTVFSPQGDIVLQKGGEEESSYGGIKHSVSLKDEVDSLPLYCTYVHNHPSNGSLSMEDILLCTRMKGTIHAITMDGGDYWSTGLSQPYAGEGEKVMIGERIPQAWRDVAMRYSRIEEMLYRGLTLQQTFPTLYKATDTDLTEQESHLVNSHICLLLLASKRFIDYHYRLGTKMKKALVKFQSTPSGKNCPISLGDESLALQSSPV